MKKNKLVATVAFLAGCLSCLGEEMSDAELRDRIVWHLAPKCGGEPGHRRPAFADEVGASNDTSRLARILAEVAQTNDAWYAEMAMWRLEQYGTPAQLPFLYSCATNPLVGDRAVKAVLRIEGVTSNSLDVARNYFMVTNGVPHLKEFDRTRVCRSLLKEVFDTPDLLQFQPLCMSITLEFGKNVNIGHISLDDTIRDVDPTYRYSKRRLAVMRSAQSRCINPGLYNYVTNAINELVAYPEANLPE